MKYISVYKCKICGAKFHGDWKVSDKNDVWYAQDKDMIRMHDCENGSIGVSDFIGMEKIDGQ